MHNMKNSCTNCLLNNRISNVTIHEDNRCNYCHNYKPFTPLGEDKLIQILKSSVKKHRKYDALVPLSGGKDSAYVLYLAVKKYHLNVLTYTYDNGFLSELALQNIETITRECDVDHMFIRPNKKELYKAYKTALVESGEYCGVCGIGIERTMLQLARKWKIPIILLGHTPTEENTATTEHIYDPGRLKYILSKNKDISKKEIKNLFVFPHLNFVSSYIKSRIGVFAKKINMLYYIESPSDKEVTKILEKEINWTDSASSEYTRHFDCLAEPFSNFVREKRFGYSRRILQLSSMIRTGEISISEAEEILKNDKKNEIPEHYNTVINTLNLTTADLEKVFSLPTNIYNDKVSTMNRVFALLRKRIKTTG